MRCLSLFTIWHLKYGVSQMWVICHRCGDFCSVGCVLQIGLLLAGISATVALGIAWTDSVVFVSAWALQHLLALWRSYGLVNSC